MRSYTAWGLRFSIVVYVLLHFITYFYENKTLLLFLSVSGLLLVVFACVTLTLQQFKLPFALVLIGIIILIASGEFTIKGLFNGFLQMRNMVGLLVVVPMIGWVLREKPYMEAIMSFGQNVLNTRRKFYLGIISFTQIIAYFLLFGSIPMMYQVVNMVLKDRQSEAWENFKGTALLRGFALSTLWVVSIPSFAFVVETMDASLSISIIQGMGLAICGVIIAVIFSHFEEKKYGIDLTAGLQEEIKLIVRDTPDNEQRNRYIIEFAILFITLFGSIFFLHATQSVELLVLIPLVVGIWIMVYYVLNNRLKKLMKEAKTYVLEDMDKQSYQLSMMLGAGMLIYALNQTGFANFVVNGIYSLQASLPFINILYFLPFMVIILGFFGLGPLTVMVLLGGILESIQLPYPPELIVVAITLGSAISILLSPLIMPIIALSGVNGLSGFKNGIRFNWKYALILYIVGQIYVQGSVLL